MKFSLTKEFDKKETRYFCGCSVSGDPCYHFEDFSQHRKTENTSLFQTEYICYKNKKYAIEKWQKVENHD